MLSSFCYCKKIIFRKDCSQYVPHTKKAPVDPPLIQCCISGSVPIQLDPCTIGNLGSGSVYYIPGRDPDPDPAALKLLAISNFFKFLN